MASDLIRKKWLIDKIQNTASEVCKKAPYDAEWFTRMQNRQLEIICLIEDTPTFNGVGYGYLANWYISSVSDEDKPVWTDEHIEELLGDFVLIPRISGNIEPVHWVKEECGIWSCSRCGKSALLNGGEEYELSTFCPHCGADMRGEKDE